FYTVKENINKTKRQPIEWEKIFANDISDKEINKVHIQLYVYIYPRYIYIIIQLNTPKNQIIQLKNGQRHMKICSALIIRKMQTKTIMRYCFIPVKIVKIKTQGITSIGENMEEKETLVNCWWECKLVQPLWKTI
ncbi:LORF2 protein, partial [Crocuta crocuta]